MTEKRKISIYDTTLRDGAQSVDVSFSLQDKLAIAQELDRFKIDYIEGGWPGSNPKDNLFFTQIKEQGLQHAKIAAFSSTKRPKIAYYEDKILQSLVNCSADVLTIFAKSWDFHVTEALGISLEENLDLVYGTISFLKDKDFEVFLDAEHFFDGYKSNPDYALNVLATAQKAGADMLVLCDTNGGCLPTEISNITETIVKNINLPLGIHTHNDAGLGVANSLSAVIAGACSVQGTINGLGERCGNCDLTTIMPNLALKMGYELNAQENLSYLKKLSSYVNETANLRSNRHAPYVGRNAFAHKGGIHVSAISKNPLTYEHIKPEQVGNKRKITISELAGRSNVLAKAKEFGVDLNTNHKNLTGSIMQRVKVLEERGFSFESGEASFELLIKEAIGDFTPAFNLKGFRLLTDANSHQEITTEATIKVEVDGIQSHTAADGNGPIEALDNAIRKALLQFYPELKDLYLADYKVRVIDQNAGTGAKVRVLIDHSFNGIHYGTIGVSENIIEASWNALVDGVEYMLLLKQKQEIKEKQEREK